jgi:MscS family membrane protein
MKEILQYKLFDNAVSAYLVVVLSIAFAFLLKRLISKYLAKLLFRLVKGLARGVDRQSFINLVVQPLEIFVVIIISIVAIDKLYYPKVLELKIYRIGLRQFIDTVSVSTLIITFIWLLLRIIDFIALILEQKANKTLDHSDNQLIVFFKDFFKVVLVIVGILLVLQFGFNKDVGSLLTGLSIATAAIALATRESLENLIASFIIFFDKPFTTGDVVKVHQVTGTVEKIGLRSTRLRTDQKTWVSVPNKQMVDSIMDNLSLRTQRRADLKLMVDLQTSPQQMDALVAGIKEILTQEQIEGYSVFFTDITQEGFVVPIEYYTAPIGMDEFNGLKQSVNIQVLNLIRKLDIELSGAASDIRISGPNTGS